MRLKDKQRLDYTLGGVGIFVLKPLAVLLGNLLRRDHSLIVKDHVAVIKMLGGGSLVIALPALLGLRRKYPHIRLSLVTTSSLKPFADGWPSLMKSSSWTTSRSLRYASVACDCCGVYSMSTRLSISRYTAG